MFSMWQTEADHVNRKQIASVVDKVTAVCEAEIVALNQMKKLACESIRPYSLAPFMVSWTPHLPVLTAPSALSIHHSRVAPGQLMVTDRPGIEPHD
jgi:hypothetical protein